MSELGTRLRGFDGKHTAGLDALAKTLRPDDIDELCRLAVSDEAKLQIASTWLLKRLAERGHKLDAGQSAAVLMVLESGGHWQARLHALQMLESLSVGDDEAEALWTLLVIQLQTDKKFIRAWAYHGLAALADGQPRYRKRAATRLRRAQGEAASVRARIRRLRKRYDWLEAALS